MTDKEKAVIMAHTGICMLTGEKFSIYHKYIEELMGRPVFTHELANAKTVNQIKEKSKEDFLKLCKDEFVPESCEDYISRKDAIDTAIEAVDDWDGGYNLTRADIIEKAIKSLPSVQPKAKTGYWECNELFGDGEIQFVNIRCSECGNEMRISPYRYNRLHDLEKYCSVCDCKMEG